MVYCTCTTVCHLHSLHNWFTTSSLAAFWHHSTVSPSLPFFSCSLQCGTAITFCQIIQHLYLLFPLLLAQCARASDVQARHHGVQLPARSSAGVLGRPLPTSLRRRFSAASQIRQSTTPGSSASPVANVRPTGFLCCWPVGLELTAWQFERCECHQRQLPQTFENTFVCSVLKHPAH